MRPAQRGNQAGNLAIVATNIPCEYMHLIPFRLNVQRYIYQSASHACASIRRSAPASQLCYVCAFFNSRSSACYAIFLLYSWPEHCPPSAQHREQKRMPLNLQTYHDYLASLTAFINDFVVWLAEPATVQRLPQISPMLPSLPLSTSAVDRQSARLIRLMLWASAQFGPRLRNED